MNSFPIPKKPTQEGGNMNRENLSGRVNWYSLLLFLVLPAIVMTAPMAQAATQTISGNPLQVACYDDGSMAASVWDGVEYVDQYYDGNDWGSLVFFDNGGSTLAYADSYHASWDSEAGVVAFTPVSNTMPTAWQVNTVMDAGASGLRVSQRVEYTNGADYYKMTWTITNSSAATYTNLKFIHGGDAYFADDDDAQSFWDDSLGMVYLRNPGLSGLMGFYGGAGSRASAYNAGDYGDGVDLAVAGQLNNTVDEVYQDAGYHLQWDRASLAPGATWTITAFEKWTEAGDVQVLAPADEAGAPGSVVSLPFTVQNFQETTDTFDLSVASALGWTVSLAGSPTVTLEAGESATITVNVTVPEDAGDGVDTVTLTATSQDDDTVTNSDSASVSGGGEASAGGTGVHHHSCFMSASETSGTTGTILIAAAFLGLCGIVVRRKA